MATRRQSLPIAALSAARGAFRMAEAYSEDALAAFAGERGAGARPRGGSARLPGRGPGDVPAVVADEQGGVRGKVRLREARAGARRADRAGRRARRAGDRTLPGARPPAGEGAGA